MFSLRNYITCTYCVDDDLQCGGIISQPSGTIQSPDRDGDGVYDNNLRCHWVIVPPRMFAVKITFLYLNITRTPYVLCANDSLLVSITKTCPYDNTAFS